MKTTNGKLPQYFREYLDERFNKVNEDIADLKEDIKAIKGNYYTFGECAEGLKHDLMAFTWRIKIITYFVGGIALLFLVHIGLNDGIGKYLLGFLGL